MIVDNLSISWQQLLEFEFKKPHFKNLIKLVNLSYSNSVVYPPKNLIFSAFNLTSFNAIKVVIIGQDPYHKKGQANGLSFSVNDEIKIPPSLKNVFKEMKNDIPNFEIPQTGNLKNWAKNGIFLLNAILTVEEAKPSSHKHFGWELFTDAVIKLISDNKQNVVFLLWGNYAINKKHLIDTTKHLVLEAAHPSPLARGKFFGCKHFSKANAYLKEEVF